MVALVSEELNSALAMEFSRTLNLCILLILLLMLVTHCLFLSFMVLSHQSQIIAFNGLVAYFDNPRVTKESMFFSGLSISWDFKYQCNIILFFKYCVFIYQSYLPQIPKLSTTIVSSYLNTMCVYAYYLNTVYY